MTGYLKGMELKGLGQLLNLNLYGMFKFLQQLILL